MSHFICIKHPKYNGKTSPVLSCSTCCSIYVQDIKESKTAIDQKLTESDKEIESTKKWIEKKRKESIKLTFSNLF